MTKNNQGLSLFREFLRKIFHLGIVIFPIGYHYLGKWPLLEIIVPITVIVVLFDYLRRKNDKINTIFSKVFDIILRPKEKGQLTGLSWAFISACVVLLLCKREIAILSLLILAICDLASSLLGKAVKSEPFFEKTFVGSAAFFLSGLLVLIFAGKMLNIGFLFYIFALFSLFAVTIIEARPSFLKIDDNLTIPVVFAGLMTSFDLIWGVV